MFLFKDDTKSIFLPDKTANHMENPIEGNRKEEKRDKRVTRIKKQRKRKWKERDRGIRFGYDELTFQLRETPKEVD